MLGCERNVFTGVWFPPEGECGDEDVEEHEGLEGPDGVARVWVGCCEPWGRDSAIWCVSEGEEQKERRGETRTYGRAPWA